MDATLVAFVVGSMIIPSTMRQRLFVSAWLPVAEAPCGCRMVVVSEKRDPSGSRRQGRGSVLVPFTLCGSTRRFVRRSPSQRSQTFFGITLPGARSNFAPRI